MGQRLALVPIETSVRERVAPPARAAALRARVRRTRRRESMEPTDTHDDLEAAVRHSERDLDGANATERYLDHAKHARAFDEALRARGASIKGGYRAAGLSYLLARKALWLAEFVRDHDRSHPDLAMRGPSILLFAREAERRLEREGRSREIPLMLEALAAGTPRDAVRKKFLAAPTAPISALFSALRSGRTEPARRAFTELSPQERAEVALFSHALGRLVRSAADGPAARGTLEAASSIETALARAAETAA